MVLFKTHLRCVETCVWIFLVIYDDVFLESRFVIFFSPPLSRGAKCSSGDVDEEKDVALGFFVCFA